MASPNLYQVTRKSRRYDAYSDFLVCAYSGQDALTFHPDRTSILNKSKTRWIDSSGAPIFDHGWVEPSEFNQLEVKLVGIATSFIPRGVMYVTYNDG